MGVGVHQGAVMVRMAVAAGEPVGVVVVVVVVVVDVLVIVLQGDVTMIVFVARPERDTHSDGRHDDRGDLQAADVLAEHRPRDRCPDERCRSKDHLAACGAEIVGALHPQGDREPVAGGADDQRRDQIPGTRRRPPAGDEQSDREVGAAGDHAFECDDVLRGEVFDSRSLLRCRVPSRHMRR